MKEKIKIGDKWIGKDERAFIIAEAGSNHDRKLDQAKQLIDVAADSGVDAVKFQLFKAESFYSTKDPMFKIMKKNELPREWVKNLCEYAKNRGLMFLGSVFDVEAIDLLHEIDSPAFKWASSETANLSLLRYAATKKKPMIISTGMCNLADIYEAVEVVHSTGNQDIVLLNCTSLYPTEPRHINFRVMDTLRDTFHLPVGYSDHSLGFLMSAVAAARGACVIEKHFTISRKLMGPDHSYALEPDELTQMVRAIRDVEESLGSPMKRMLTEEREKARRESLIAKRHIAKGTKLTKDMIAVKRPALGIEPRFLEVVIGQETKEVIKKDEPICWEMI
jgi:N-acetylneuraminate synthase/N,N'-diacetyllegionaminate synthase